MFHLKYGDKTEPRDSGCACAVNGHPEEEAVEMYERVEEVMENFLSFPFSSDWNTVVLEDGDRKQVDRYGLKRNVRETRRAVNSHSHFFSVVRCSTTQFSRCFIPAYTKS